MRGIPSDEEFIRNLSFSLGYLAVGFGLFEFSCNAAVATIFHFAGGRAQIRKTIPWASSECAQFLTDSATKLDILTPFADRITTLMATATRLAGIRNHVLHGYISEYLEDSQTLVFRKIDPERPRRDMHFESVLRITVQDLLSAGEHAHGLSAEMAVLAHELVEALAPTEEPGVIVRE